MAADQTKVVSVNAASTTIPFATYVELSPSTPINCTKMVITNTTAKIVKLAIGAASSEVDLVGVLPSGMLTLDIGLNVMPKGSRISLQSVVADATTGVLTVSFLP